MPWFRWASSSPEDRFADEVIALVRDLLGREARRTGGFALRIEQPVNGPVTMNLRNIYAEAQELDGDARAQRLRTAVLGMLPGPRPADWSTARPRLLPAVRRASWANTAIAAGEPGGVPFGMPLVPFVKVLCAIDSEHAITFATADDLLRWDVSDDEALRTASANLGRLPCEMKLAASGPAVMITGPDGYASSWLAAPATLAGIAASIENFPSPVIAVAVTRDLLYLFAADNPEFAARILGEAFEHYQSAVRRLSPVPYLVTETGISPWAPSPGHPARPVAGKAARYLAAAEYDEQKTMLDELLPKAGEDVHVAAYELMQEADGSCWSWTGWAATVTSGLLPHADLVVIDGMSPADHFAVPWDDALRIAGSVLKEEAAYDPPRWRHLGRPDDGTLAALRAAAVPFPGTDR